ncbi:MAG TPA: STAS domain-containing protein [Roseiflexaceae bacterium]|nr:STAS domain-containing protein [Roseiflexaceae bacterium]
MLDVTPSMPASSPVADCGRNTDQIEQLHARVAIQHAWLNALPMGVTIYEIVSRTEFRCVFINPAGLQPDSQDINEVLGKRLEDLVDPQSALQLHQQFQICIGTGTAQVVEASYPLPTGLLWTNSTFAPVRNAEGHVTHIMAVWEDITERKQREAEERQRQEEIIEQQQAVLAEISTPLLAISETTVVMPLIGTVDSHRVQQIMDTLLAGVAASRARMVILDITGVAVVDTQVANAFVRASQAVSLLGCQAVVTGIRPEVAQTLVGLGVDLHGIITRGTLRDGITYALTN